MLQLFVRVLPAEGDLSSLAGGSGWAGAGLLGLVLLWIFFVGWPQVLKTLREIVQEHKETEEKQRATHSALEREQRAECKEAMEAFMEHSRTELREIASRLPKAEGPVPPGKMSGPP